MSGVQKRWSAVNITGVKDWGAEVNIIFQTRLQYHKGLASGVFLLTANNISCGETHGAASSAESSPQARSSPVKLGLPGQVYELPLGNRGSDLHGV